MQMPGRVPESLFLVLFATTIAGTPACHTEDPVLLVAAASTIDAVEAAVADFSAEGRPAVEVSFGPTSLLARQIEEGAPADLMLSASVAWADHVEQRVPVARRLALVANQLAVVVPAATPDTSQSLPQIAASPRFTRIAIADPASVPAGIYAAEALRRIGLWEALQPRLIPAVDVRAALALVVDGETDAGLVYATDALAAGAAVHVIARVDPSLHAAIEYPLLLLRGARPPAVRFFEYLTSARGRAHFHERGFIDVGR